MKPFFAHVFALAPIFVIAGCAAEATSAGAPTAGGEQDVTAVELPTTLHFANLTTKAPKDWSTWADGTVAFVGPLAGGPSDMPLAIERGFEGTIDELAPTECVTEGNPPAAARSVKVVEEGLRPMGTKKADFRRWEVSCADGSTRKLRGWLLPTSKVAVREQVEGASNEAVVATIEVGPKTDLRYENITFHVPNGWDMTQYDADDIAYLGVHAGGQSDLQMYVSRHFEDGVDSLAPHECSREGDEPVSGTAKILEQGLKPVGSKKADYRKWLVTCADGTSRELRAWVLPVSKLAIVEQVAWAELDFLLAEATVD